MGSPEIERIRSEAGDRISGRPSLVLDGDPIEELARAHERHAERLDSLADAMHDIARENHLGQTSEGRSATRNIQIAVHDHPQSVVRGYRSQAKGARAIAAALRDIGAAIRSTEGVNADSLSQVGV